jgi:hypothetical protein
MFATRQKIAKTIAGCFVILLAVIAALSLPNTGTAANDVQVASYEGESFAYKGNADVVSGLAYASGGSALRLWTNAVATKTSTVPAATRLVVKARKGAQCGGTPPHMTVKVDGAQVLSADVTAINFSSDSSEYSVGVKIAAGNHTFSVANDSTDASCDRALRFDVLVLYGLPQATASTCSTSSLGTINMNNLPEACWRPFSDQSPFNQEIPASAKLEPRSSEIVARMMAGGAPNSIRAGIADTSGDYYKPTYYATAADPLYTLKTGGYLHDGETIRMPQGAREAAGSDHHLTVIQPDGAHWGFWNAKVDNSTHTIAGNSTNSGKLTARKSSLSGPGVGGNSAGCGATAAGFCTLAGVIRAQELEGGEINHALFMTSSVSASSYVYPANNSDGSHSAASDYPPQGARFQLALSDSQIDALSVPAWKKTILRALAHYGAYLGDSSGAPSFALQMESGTMYTSMGRQDEMVKFAQSAGVPSSGGVYYLDLAGGVDWTQHLRVVAPCTTQGTC